MTDDRRRWKRRRCSLMAELVFTHDPRSPVLPAAKFVGKLVDICEAGARMQRLGRLLGPLPAPDTQGILKIVVPDGGNPLTVHATVLSASIHGLHMAFVQKELPSAVVDRLLGIVGTDDQPRDLPAPLPDARNEGVI